MTAAATAPTSIEQSDRTAGCKKRARRPIAQTGQAAVALSAAAPEILITLATLLQTLYSAHLYTHNRPREY